MSILWDTSNYTKIKEIGMPVITSGTVNMGGGVYKLKAGTPISDALAVANTSSAKYLVAEDFFFYANNPTQPKLVKVIETGYVDLALAEAASGLTFTSDAKSALATEGIILVDGALQTGGGGENGVLLITVTQDADYNLVADKTYAEAVEALEDGSALLMYYAPGHTFYQLDEYDTLSLRFSYVYLDTSTGEVVKFFLIYTSSSLYDDTSSGSLFAFPEQVVYSGGEDGTYMLTCTVSDDGSNIVYDWTSVGS